MVNLIDRILQDVGLEKELDYEPSSFKTKSIEEIKKLIVLSSFN